MLIMYIISINDPFSIVSIFQVRPGEPVYAQVNRDKKRSRGPGGLGDYGEAGHHWVVSDQGGRVLDNSQSSAAPTQHNNQGGDSWV